MPWWQEIIFWVLAFVAYVLLMNWLPQGWVMLLLLTIVGVIAWRIWKRG